MPFTIFTSDSGTDPKQRVANATGLIVAASRIVSLEKEWDKLRKKEGFGDFHTSEFVYRNKKSEFADWDDVKHKRVFRRVREIAKKYGAQAFLSRSSNSFVCNILLITSFIINILRGKQVRTREIVASRTHSIIYV